MGIYKFKPDDAVDFAYFLGAKVNRHGDELFFEKCPYCQGNTKDKKTFSINLKTGQFKCFRASCGRTGNMLTLQKDFGFSLGRDADEYYKPSRKYRNIHKDASKIEVRDPAVAYMKKRGISADVVGKYHITTRKDNDSIIVFPFYDTSGKLQFVKYRDADFTEEKKAQGANKEWCEANCKPILFGMDQCDTKIKTLVLTEGQIDSLSCAEAGIPNAVSVPTGAQGFTWYPYCYDFLKDFTELVVFGDHEHGHITLLEDMRNRFHGVVKHVKEEDYKGCKDANEILLRHGREAIVQAVMNAVADSASHIIRLADVEDPDDDDLESFSSGFPSIDAAAGGLQLGQLVVLTGQTGLGKSTFGEQLATFAVKEGYRTLIYSGELRNKDVRRAIDRQVAGPDFIGERPRPRIPGYLEPVVYKMQQEQIHSWYRERLFLYDVSGLYRKDAYEDDEQTLFDTLERAIIQNGVEVMLIDNLMTAIDDDSSIDQYRQQTMFVKRLKALVMTYKVLIILVAHPRKTSAERLGNDEVAGSANITNLADMVIGFTSLTKDEAQTYKESGCNRKITITKNRITGRLSEAIPVFYNRLSGRVVEMEKTSGKYDPTKRPNFLGPQFNYGWQPEFTSVDDVPDEIPF